MTLACGAANASFSRSRPKKRKYSRCDGAITPSIRSSCSRSIITTSQPAMPLRMSL